MKVTVSEVKAYMHAEGDPDESVYRHMMMAVGYLEGAGIFEANSPTDAYTLALKALTLHFYDNRGGTDIPAGLANIITQLQYRQEANA